MIDICEIIASLVESMIVVRLCTRFLGFKSKNWTFLKSVLFFIALSAENILLSQREGFKNIAAGFFLLLIFVYALLFLDGKIYEKILISIVPPATILMINLIVLTAFRISSGYFVTELIEPGGRARISVLIFSKLAFFFVCEFLLHIRRHGQYSLNGFQWGMQLSCFFVTFLIAYSLFSISIKTDELSLFLFVSVMIALLNILLYMMLYKMQHDNIVREEYRISRINLAAQKRYVDEARERYMEMRTLRHDMRHYLMAAAELISSGREMEAKDYIEKIIDEKVDRTTAGIDTGNVVIDAVINNRLAVCMKKGIEMKCMIDSCFRDVDDMDISILLSNVLDNAISGCADAESPEVELVVGTRKSFTYIIVKNSIAGSVLSRNPNLKTDKEGTSHGFGIMSVRKIAEKYGGSVEFKEENGSFITEIWLEGLRV